MARFLVEGYARGLDSSPCHFDWLCWEIEATCVEEAVWFYVSKNKMWYTPSSPGCLDIDGTVRVDELDTPIGLFCATAGGEVYCWDERYHWNWYRRDWRPADLPWNDEVPVGLKAAITKKRLV